MSFIPAACAVSLLTLAPLHAITDPAANGSVRATRQTSSVSGTLGPAVTVDRDDLGVAPLADALDTTNLLWTTAGHAPWSRQASLTHDGSDAAVSGPLGDGQASQLQTTVEGPGVLSFWWKVSSEYEFDWLSFQIEATQQAAISGEPDWELLRCAVPAGPQTLRWIYAKDSAEAWGLDAAWVDEISYTPTTAPMIVATPESQAVWRGSNATLTVTAAGVEPFGRCAA